MPLARHTVVRPVLAGHAITDQLLAHNPDGLPITFEKVDDSTEPAQGSVDLNPDGSFTYTANPDASGRDGFSFVVKYEEYTSPPQRVYLTVQPHGHRVVAVGDSSYGKTDVGSWGATS